MFYIYSFVIGICIGSFVNVVIYRLPLGENFIVGRSYCPKCHHVLSPLDLVPIFSYLFLKGKCRYCHNKISFRYTFIELLGGILAVLCYHRYGFSFEMIIFYSLSMIFVAISFIDLDTMIIPDELILCCLCISLLSISFMEISFFDRVLGAFIISFPMFLFNFIIESFGGGDIKLIAVMGFMLGWFHIIIAIYIAFIMAGCYALYLVISKRSKLNSYIAFGPYICMGVFISLLYGNQLLMTFLF